MNIGPIEILTGLLVLITGYYAVQAHRQAQATQATVREMQATRDAEAAPYVVAYFDMPYGEWVIYLVVRNTGRTPALNVRVTFAPPVSTFLPDASNPVVAEFLTKPMPMLPPLYETRTQLWTHIEAFDTETTVPQSYRATINYDDLMGRPRGGAYNLDFSAFRNRGYEPRVTLNEIQGELKHLVEEFRHRNRDERVWRRGERSASVGPGPDGGASLIARGWRAFRRR